MYDFSLTRRDLLMGVPVLCCTQQALLAQDHNPAPSAVDRVLDQIVASERKVLSTLSERTPVVETYIQENLTAADRAGETRDHYFLGRMGLLKTVRYVSFVRRQSEPQFVLETKTTSRMLFLKRTTATERIPEHVEYHPEGFAQMTVIDASSFDRKTYKFDYVRREFTGDVRCLVFDVTPLRPDDQGRFVGRIWVEDQNWFVVRINGTYTRQTEGELYFHFDSWRVNPAPGVWIPSVIYIEDSVPLNGSETAGAAPMRFKAQARIWSYDSPTNNRLEELTAILVDAGRNVNDSSDSQELSPIEGQRRWESDAENNVLERLERIGLVSPQGEVDKVLNTVVKNLIVTNNLQLEAHCRLLLTTPLETFTIGRTVAISRGLVDVLPDEPSLALVLASELAHIALGHPTRTEYAFNDRTMLGDEEVLERFRFTRTSEEVAAASKKTVAMLAASPYKDKMGNAGLFLRALKAKTVGLTHLIQPNFGNDLTRYLELPEFQNLLAQAPVLEENKLEQIAALPLGSRVRVEPWSNHTFLMKPRAVSLLSAREKMPFEVSPITVYLTRAGQDAENAAVR
jgi:hypothetical protein